MYLLILQDGETFTSLDGCEVVRVDERTLDLLHRGWKPKHLEDEIEHVISFRQEE